MTSEKLSEVIGMIDDDIIAAADKSRTEMKRSKKPLWIGVCSTAACAALITAVALTDPASYLSGEDIVDHEYDSSTSTAMTTEIPKEDNNAGGVITTETLDEIETCDGAGLYTEECIIVETNDAVDAPSRTETADVVIDADDTEEAIDDTPIVEEAIPDTNDAPEDVEEATVITESGDEAEDAVAETCDVAETGEESAGYEDIIKVDSSVRRYENVELMEQSVTGAPQSYEELHDYLSVYSDSMNFIQYEITAQYTPESAYALTGSDIFLYSTTLYQAKATYDLLNGEPLNYSFFLSDAGTAEEQIEGMPLLSVGERYASVLSGGGKDSQYVAFPELTFAIYRQGAEVYAYHLRFDRIRFIKPDGTDIDLGINADEEYIITSTGNNPVHYVHKYELSELAEFFRDDWTKRGYKFPSLFTATVPIE